MIPAKSVGAIRRFIHSGEKHEPIYRGTTGDREADQADGRAVTV